MSSNFTRTEKRKLKMVLSMLMLYIQWLSKFSVLIVILHAFIIDFNTIQIYVRQWVIYITMLFIPTPGASGGAEASFLLIFGKVFPLISPISSCRYGRLFTYYFLLVAVVIFYSLLSYFLRKEEDLVIETQD
ncbi:MAG: flippase-like domain-containing protein [Saprospiraceae bacterium]|nr:flippase-like domain-containing protein [Saprospiraceae bacterium]